MIMSVLAILGGIFALAVLLTLALIFVLAKVDWSK
jgi:hypothetical protein